MGFSDDRSKIGRREEREREGGGKERKIGKNERGMVYKARVRIARETSFYWKHVWGRRERISRRGDKKPASERRK